MAETVSKNIFSHLSTPRDLTKYTLMRGVTDFGKLEQFNLYETGYSFLIVTRIPKFLQELGAKNSEYKKLIDTYVHILEYEFRGLEGLENLTTDTAELTNGIKKTDIITKVTRQGGSNFSMRFQEKAGSVITKVHELFLTGIKDPDTQVKTYHGLLQDGTMEKGYENEVFNFLYIVTDNSLMQVEKAYFLAAAQPTTAELSIYNSEKGDIQFKEISVEFNAYPIHGIKINEKAVELLKWIRDNTTWREALYNYDGVENMQPYSNNITTSDGELIAMK